MFVWAALERLTPGRAIGKKTRKIKMFLVIAKIDTLHTHRF